MEAGEARTGIRSKKQGEKLKSHPEYSGQKAKLELESRVKNQESRG